MDALALLAVAVAVAIGVTWLSARRRRGRNLRGRPAERPEDFAGLFAAGLPVALPPLDDETRAEDDADAADLEQLDLEEGALDPDELYDDPVVWDEGADDELG